MENKQPPSELEEKLRKISKLEKQLEAAEDELRATPGMTELMIANNAAVHDLSQRLERLYQDRDRLLPPPVVTAPPPQTDARQAFIKLLKKAHVDRPEELVLDTIAANFSSQMLTATTVDLAYNLYHMVGGMPTSETKMQLRDGLDCTSVNGPVWQHLPYLLSASGRDGKQLMVKVLVANRDDPRTTYQDCVQQVNFEADVCEMLELANISSDMGLVRTKVTPVSVEVNRSVKIGLPTGNYKVLVMSRYVTTLAQTAQLDAELVVRGGRRMEKALKYIHDHDLVHMDVKPDNIFIDADGNWFLGDFGSCRPTNTEIVSYTEAFYPERLYGKNALPGYDWYMLAVSLLIELLPDKREWHIELCLPYAGRVNRERVNDRISKQENESVKEMLTTFIALSGR